LRVTVSFYDVRCFDITRRHLWSIEF
jgi:hypothetical protein